MHDGVTMWDAVRVLDAFPLPVRHAVLTHDRPEEEGKVRLQLRRSSVFLVANPRQPERPGQSGGTARCASAGKGDKPATVVLPPVVVDALEVYLAGRTTGPLFVTTSGARLDRSQAFRVMRRLARQAGVDNADRIGLHNLRASAITALFDSGATMRDVHDFARHADPGYSLDRAASYALSTYLSTADPASARVPSV